MEAVTQRKMELVVDVMEEQVRAHYNGAKKITAKEEAEVMCMLNEFAHLIANVNDGGDHKTRNQVRAVLIDAAADAVDAIRTRVKLYSM